MDIKKIWCVIITMFIASNTIISMPLSFDILEKHYSLLMILSDQEHNEYIGVVSAKHLLHGDVLYIKKTKCVYRRVVWDSISSLWHDGLNAHDIGCYFVKALVDRQNQQKIMLEVDVPFIQLQKTKTTLGTVIFEKNLTYAHGILIPQDLLMEFNLVAMMPEKEAHPQVNFDQELFNELPDLDYQPEELSRLEIMIRQVGIALLMRYIDLREYCAESYKQLKHVLYSRIYERFSK